MTEERTASLPLKSLVVPAVVTLGVTLLRLTGELLGWSARLFGDSGGGGALVGIVWLVPLFGLFFGWKLATLEYRPARAGRAVGLCLLALAVVLAVAVVMALMKVTVVTQVLAVSVAGALAGIIGLRAWPELGGVLLFYGLAARVPVVAVYLAAFLGRWGTHYDAIPPGWPAMNVWMNFVLLGLVPQLTLWLGYTIVVGTLFGIVGAALVRKHTEVEVGRRILDALKAKQGR